MVCIYLSYTVTDPNKRQRRVLKTITFQPTPKNQSWLAQAKRQRGKLAKTINRALSAYRGAEQEDES